MRGLLYFLRSDFMAVVNFIYKKICVQMTVMAPGIRATIVRSVCTLRAFADHLN